MVVADGVIFMNILGGYGVLKLAGRNNCCQYKTMPSPINVDLLNQLFRLYKASLLLGDML